MSNWKLYSLFLFIAITSCIILTAIWEETGGMHNDSMFYLHLAYNIADGQGLTVHEKTMTTWPPVYSLLIAVSKFVLPVSIFWAGKLTNIVVLISLFILIIWFARDESPLYLWLLTLAPVLSLFTQTLSEPLFITGCLLFVLVLHKAIRTGKSSLLFFAGCFPFFLFMIRYIGFFAGGVVITVAIVLYLKNFKKQAGYLVQGGLFSIIAASIWLLYSYLETGFITGAERTLSHTSFASGLFDLFKALIDDLNILAVLGNQRPLIYIVAFLTQCLILILIVTGIKKRNITFPFKLPLLSGIAILAAIWYLVSISVIHLVFNVYSFYYRLTAPGLFLLLFAFIHYLIKVSTKEFYTYLFKCLSIGSVVTLFVFGPLHVIEYKKGDRMLRSELEFSISAFYSEVPSGSIVILAHRELYYLRPDLIVSKPHFAPYQEKEPWIDFIERLQTEHPNRAINLFVFPPENVTRDFHPSVVEELTERFKGSLEIKRLSD